MYGRESSHQDLFPRDSSEPWSQVDGNSLDWLTNSQFLSSQEPMARVPMTPIRGRPPSSRVHTVPTAISMSSRGCATTPSVVRPMGGFRPQAFSQGSLDATLGRDVRYGLHTILNVLRELPEQLREVSQEITRSLSQQGEEGLGSMGEARAHLRETSEKLQTIVLSVEEKLGLLLAEKEDGSRETLVSQLTEQLTTLTSAINAGNKMTRKFLKKLRCNVKKDLDAMKVEMQVSFAGSLDAKINEVLLLRSDLNDMKEVCVVMHNELKESKIHLNNSLQMMKLNNTSNALMLQFQQNLDSVNKKLHSLDDIKKEQPVASNVRPTGSAFWQSVKPLGQNLFHTQMSPMAEVRPQVVRDILVGRSPKQLNRLPCNVPMNNARNSPVMSSIRNAASLNAISCKPNKNVNTELLQAANENSHAAIDGTQCSSSFDQKSQESSVIVIEYGYASDSSCKSSLSDASPCQVMNSDSEEIFWLSNKKRNVDLIDFVSPNTTPCTLPDVTSVCEIPSTPAIMVQSGAKRAKIEGTELTLGNYCSSKKPITSVGKRYLLNMNDAMEGNFKLKFVQKSLNK